MAQQSLHRLGQKTEALLLSYCDVDYKELSNWLGYINPASLWDEPMSDRVFRYLYNRVIQYGRICNSCTYADIAFGDKHGAGIYSGTKYTSVYGSAGASQRKRIRQALQRLQQKNYIKLISTKTSGFIYIINYHHWLTRFIPSFNRKKQDVYDRLVAKTKWITLIDTHAIGCLDVEDGIMDIEEALKKAVEQTKTGETKRKARVKIRYPNTASLIGMINEYRADRNMPKKDWTGRSRGMVSTFLRNQEGETVREKFKKAEAELVRAMDDWSYIRKHLSIVGGNNSIPYNFSFEVFYANRDTIRDLWFEQEAQKTRRHKQSEIRVYKWV